jgi:hypothetical protein
VRTGAGRKGLARNSRAKDVNDTFIDWDEKKPRHTHTAAYAILYSLWIKLSLI